jgi:hypothetical protein
MCARGPPPAGGAAGVLLRADAAGRRGCPDHLRAFQRLLRGPDREEAAEPLPARVAGAVVRDGRARLVLLDDSTFTDAEVALRVRAPGRRRTGVRRQLEGLGVLPASRWPEPAFPALRGHRPPAPGPCSSGPASATPAGREVAKRICGGCPVLAACREWSLGLPQEDPAVWGAGRLRTGSASGSAAAGSPSRPT